ncbi:hypothetical protein EW026_g7674 [Hermanssonia centrifuga]|uniref:Protein kinase domain-containing protein n=1 Tax=Hermanssonia centrifuga TaxID=98765 RepID=A0A4S4K8U3_9APHY|nr:hypothetical protein EW026_g7674 [Hermanssonia centrifuga]
MAITHDGVGVNAYRREIDAMKTASHPNIVKLSAFFVERTQLYIVMELALCSVAQLMKDNQCTRGVAQMINEWDAMKITYDNVLICCMEPMLAKLADFGLARAISAETMGQTFCGTEAFMAPEVAGMLRPGVEDYSEKVDAWSVGVMIFVMLSAQYPYPRDAVTKMDKTTIKWKLLPTNISDNVINLIKRLFVKDPENRFSVADTLAHPWLLQVRQYTQLDETVIQLG